MNLTIPDYYIDSETLSLDALEIAWRSKDSQEFCQLVIKNLWEITERNLNNIRDYIKGELSVKFHNLFDELMQKKVVIHSEYFQNDITKCINDVRASFSQKLLKIEGWFHIQESKFDDFNLQNLIQGNRIKFSRVFLGSLYPMQLYKVSS
ncbi:MAG: hypothetical protein LBL07_05550 [Tannerella sp.]|jgi:hypothetical protein|nr:hypothetical protein [Tannerella sp.]